MKRTKRIEKILTEHLSDFKYKIIDNSSIHKGHNNFNGEGETHIKVEIYNYTNLVLNRLQIHKKINFLLKEEFKKGLHSLQITIT